MNTNRHRYFRVFGCGCDIAQNEGYVRLSAVDLVFVSNHLEFPVRRRDGAFGDALEMTFVLKAVADQVCNRDHQEAVSLAERNQVGYPRHGAVLIHNLADDSCWDEACDAGEIDGGFGLAGADEDSTFSGTKWEDVTRTGEIVGCGGGIDCDTDGVRSISCGDAGCDAFARLDALGEGSAKARGIVLGHGAETKVVGSFFREGKADEATAEASHEVDCFGGNKFSCEGQVAFVFAIFIVDDDDHLAAAKRRDGGFNGCKG